MTDPVVAACGYRQDTRFKHDHHYKKIRVIRSLGLASNLGWVWDGFFFSVGY